MKTFAAALFISMKDSKVFALYGQNWEIQIFWFSIQSVSMQALKYQTYGTQLIEVTLFGTNLRKFPYPRDVGLPVCQNNRSPCGTRRHRLNLNGPRSTLKKPKKCHFTPQNLVLRSKVNLQVELISWFLHPDCNPLEGSN